MDSANEDKYNANAGGQQKGDVCRDFLRKVCNRGKNCKFLHPDNAEKKLEFCHDFQNSICRRRNCRFIHCTRDEESHYLENGNLPTSADEVGSRGSSTRSRQPSNGDIGLCRDFLNGKCTRGAGCKFRHQSQGDLEYERMREGPIRGGRGGWGPPDDYQYEFDRSRRLQSLDVLRAYSRYGRPSSYEGSTYLDFENGRSSSFRDLEDDNARLRQKVDLLRKQVDDLTATNEVLLQQNAQLRTGKTEVAQVHLAMVGQ
ncbi:putative zinc finger CCCH domain-containing protein 10-like [Apostichopus japonicus]|uniref:Putative zinc finger CCCH domain-containing protein 10-like n=1 Tax=Stichopus japonicus TaxID=307972 RepID=A0A2G8JQ76_STIJA|nr:putative zinc finger CCCH domain-containing protein 10-like [Apostichopus japonicus]